MKALITGSLGFVGHYLRNELENNGYDVTGLDIRPGEKTLAVDLLNAEQTLAAVQDVHPDIIIHLAAQANVAQSWVIPAKTVEINVLSAINLMEAVRNVDKNIKLVLVGSSDEYGVLGEKGVDVREDMLLNPQTPYAVSKVAQENMAQIYVKAYGMNICMTRSFNHGGAGQREGFLIPDFASGVVRVEKGINKTMKVGNLESKRDFTHVKDVVCAYRLIAEKGHPGEIYNVGSGITFSAKEILDSLCSMSSVDIEVEQDPDRMRPSDTPVICCNHSKLTEHTGWIPEYSMNDILVDVMAEWRQKIS